MPGWMKHEYTYTPSSSNVYETRSFRPRSSNVPQVPPTPVTSWLVSSRFTNVTSVPGSTCRTVGVKQ